MYPLQHLGCHPYPDEWPVHCFSTLQTMIREGTLFDDIAHTHHCVWTCQGFLAAKFLECCEPELKVVGTHLPDCNDNCRDVLLALVKQKQAALEICNASQNLFSDALKVVVAEVIRASLPVLFDAIEQYLDRFTKN